PRQPSTAECRRGNYVNGSGPQPPPSRHARKDLPPPLERQPRVAPGAVAAGGRRDDHPGAQRQGQVRARRRDPGPATSRRQGRRPTADRRPAPDAHQRRPRTELAGHSPPVPRPGQTGCGITQLRRHGPRQFKLATPAEGDAMTVNGGPTAPDTIVLIHCFWVTPRSWEEWIAYYQGKGYRVLAPAYPGFEVEVEALRADPTPIENLTVPAVIH